MPLALSVLDERKEDFFFDARLAPYMIEAFDTKPDKDEIIAGLHLCDRTGRPQIVNNWNEGYRKVLKTFEDITGVGDVLNTSFNLHGYPIVGTPEIAINTLENSGLDGLVIGNWLIMKRKGYGME